MDELPSACLHRPVEQGPERRPACPVAHARVRSNPEHTLAALRVEDVDRELDPVESAPNAGAAHPPDITARGEAIPAYRGEDEVDAGRVAFPDVNAEIGFALRLNRDVREGWQEVRAQDPAGDRELDLDPRDVQACPKRGPPLLGAESSFENRVEEIDLRGPAQLRMVILERRLHRRRVLKRLFAHPPTVASGVATNSIAADSDDGWRTSFPPARDRKSVV